MSTVQTLIQEIALPDMVSAGKPRPSLSDEVKERSGTDLNRCYQCRSCGNGCPFVQAMDYTPNQVLRLVQFGMGEKVLTCKTIWICVGCHTCSSQCPMSIDIADMMDTLRLMAVEEGVAVGKPNIIDFHEEVLRSLEKYGRPHKLVNMLGINGRPAAGCAAWTWALRCWPDASWTSFPRWCGM